MNQEFDNFIKSKLDQRSYTPDASAWEDALALIENSPKKKVIPLYLRTRFWLALIAGFILTGLSFYALSYMFAPSTTETAMIDGLKLNQPTTELDESSTSSIDESSPATLNSADLNTSFLAEKASKVYYKSIKELNTSSQNSATSYSVPTPPITPSSNFTSDGAANNKNVLAIAPTTAKDQSINLIDRNAALVENEVTIDSKPEATQQNKIESVSNTSILNKLTSSFLLDNKLAPNYLAPISPEVTGQLPSKISIDGFVGLGTNGNFQNMGLQTNVGAYVNYDLSKNWKLSFAPQLFAVRRFNNVLESAQTTAFAFGAIQQEYQVNNTWQLGLEIPVLLGYQANNQTISVGPVARFNMNAQGSLDQIQTTAFENSNTRVNEGSIDASLYQALNLGLQFNYAVKVGRKSKLIFYGSQYIDPFWRADSRKDLSIGVLFSQKLY